MAAIFLHPGGDGGRQPQHDGDAFNFEKGFTKEGWVKKRRGARESRVAMRGQATAAERGPLRAAGGSRWADGRAHGGRPGRLCLLRAWRRAGETKRPGEKRNALSLSLLYPCGPLCSLLSPTRFSTARIHCIQPAHDPRVFL